MKSSKLTLFLNLLLEEEDFHKTSYYAEKLMVSSKPSPIISTIYATICEIIR